MPVNPNIAYSGPVSFFVQSIEQSPAYSGPISFFIRGSSKNPDVAYSGPVDAGDTVYEVGGSLDIFAVVEAVGQVSGTHTGFSVFDYAQHGEPFLWSATSVPDLLTMDWSEHAHPLVSNAEAFAPEFGECHLSFRATTTCDGSPIKEKCSMVIIAWCNIGDILGAFEWEINATTFMQPLIPVFHGKVDLAITATVAGTARKIVTNPATLRIQATCTAASTKRTIKQCEIPGQIIRLTSNLPEGQWQDNPDAQFTWEEIWTCTRGPEMAPVDGYYWKLSKSILTVPWYDWNFSADPHEEIDLSDPQYGAGSWWFHVAPWNNVGFGPVTTYNVRYNHRPSVAGETFMRINGLDCINSLPFVPYLPEVPNLLSWSLSSDLDETDEIQYHIQIHSDPNFLATANSTQPFDLQAENISSNSYSIAETLEPKIYFWRVRAWDGSEYGEWSPTGAFQVNTPPDRPSELAVIQLA